MVKDSSCKKLPAASYAQMQWCVPRRRLPYDKVSFHLYGVDTKKISGYSQDEMEGVLEILKKYCDKYDFSFFGPRVVGDFRKYSDLDICFRCKKANPMDFSNLEDDFDNSDLVFRVDLVEFENCSQEFKKLIEDKEIKVVF